MTDDGVAKFTAALSRCVGFDVDVSGPIDASPCGGMAVVGRVTSAALARLQFLADEVRKFPCSSSIGDPDLYMERWKIGAADDIDARIHVFYRSDDDRATHDHPWDSLSVCLSDGGSDIAKAGSCLTVQPGMVLYRKAEYAHLVEVEQSRTLTTLFLTGPKIREWGFHCPRGWRHWTEFTRPTVGSASGGVGAGCE